MHYIEFVGGMGGTRLELTDRDLRSIGKFTRKNIAMWLNMLIIAQQWAEADPIEDFHAVCDDMDIPWATKEGCDGYRRIMEGVAALKSSREEQ